MQLYLLDTCVWRDFLEERDSSTGNELGKYATELIAKLILRRDKILLPDAVIAELHNDYDWNNISAMLQFLDAVGILVRKQAGLMHFKEAKELASKRNVSTADALIAILARENSGVLVTQDIHFFSRLLDIAKPVRPQDIT